MHRYLLASVAAVGLLLTSSDLNSANAQFGYGYGPVGPRPGAYCPSSRGYGVGYGGYTSRYASPGLSISVSRGGYSSPYYRPSSLSRYYGPSVYRGLPHPYSRGVYSVPRVGYSPVVRSYGPGVSLRLGF